MNRRSLQALAAIAAVLVIGVVLLNSRDEHGGTAGGLLLPGLKDELNDITTVTFSNTGNTTTLERQDEGWVVSERDGYSADTGKLRSVLLALADAQQLEAKTADPERHALLGLDESSAVMVRVSGQATGDQSHDVLLGDVAQQRYRYARHANDAQAWLINQNPDISADPAEWLIEDLLDVAADDVSSATILHADGEEIQIARGDDDAFTVTNLPADRELRYAGVTNATTAALQGLRLEDVKPAASLEVAPDVTARYELTDGTIIAARRYAEDGEMWFTFDATAPPDAPVDVELATDEPAEDDEEPGARERVAEITRRVNGWAYRLATYKAEALAKRWDDLLQPIGEDDN